MTGARRTIPTVRPTLPTPEQRAERAAMHQAALGRGATARMSLRPVVTFGKGTAPSAVRDSQGRVRVEDTAQPGRYGWASLGDAVWDDAQSERRIVLPLEVTPERGRDGEPDEFVLYDAEGVELLRSFDHALALLVAHLLETAQTATGSPLPPATAALREVIEDSLSYGALMPDWYLAKARAALAATATESRTRKPD